jgi:hypothetical protein
MGYPPPVREEPGPRRRTLKLYRVEIRKCLSAKAESCARFVSIRFESKNYHCYAVVVCGRHASRKRENRDHYELTWELFRFQKQLRLASNSPIHWPLSVQCRTTRILRRTLRSSVCGTVNIEISLVLDRFLGLRAILGRNRSDLLKWGTVQQYFPRSEIFSFRARLFLGKSYLFQLRSRCCLIQRPALSAGTGKRYLCNRYGRGEEGESLKKRNEAPASPSIVLPTFPNSFEKQGSRLRLFSDCIITVYLSPLPLPLVGKSARNFSCIMLRCNFCSRCAAALPTDLN